MPTDVPFEKLTAPIPGDKPVGVDPSTDGSLRRVKDARNAAGATEKKATEDGEGVGVAIPRWEALKSAGYEVLSTQAKCLDVASYLTEALVRTDGFAGLSDGFKAMRLLIEKYWDQLYPLPDSEDVPNPTPEDLAVARLRPLSRLSGSDGVGLLLEPLRWIEITDAGPGPYSFWQYSQALEYEKCSDKEKEVRAKRGTVTKADFDASMGATGVPFLQQLIKNVTSARAEYVALTEAVTKQCAAVKSEKMLVPSSASLLEAIDECISTLRFLTKGRLPEEAPAKTDAVATPGAAAPAAPAAPAVPAVDTALKTREDAFRLLGKVAEFFEKTEPQSLIPSQLKKVIRLGRLNPSDLLTEFISDKKILEEIFKINGLDSKAKSSDKS